MLFGVGGLYSLVMKIKFSFLSPEHGPPKRLTIMHMESGTKLAQYTTLTQEVECKLARENPCSRERERELNLHNQAI